MKRYLLTGYLLLSSLVTFAQDVQKLQEQLEAAKTYQDKIYALDALANYYTWSLSKDSVAEVYGNKQIFVLL